jgi:hypothetical protein
MPCTGRFTSGAALAGFAPVKADVGPQYAPVGRLYGPLAPFQAYSRLRRSYDVATLAFMTIIRFEWDRRKAAANLRKHGVSFEEARSVFFDDQARLIDDPDHSEDEDRFVLLGLSGALRLLLVCHCYRSGDEVIRIISARRATRTEAKFYR